VANDKKTIGITPVNAPTLNRLVADGRFGSELDAAKFAMAYAIRQAVPVGSADGAETKWNVGSVDPDGSIRAMLQALYPDASEPYRHMEHLMNEGLRGLVNDDGRLLDIYELIFADSEAAPEPGTPPG